MVQGSVCLSNTGWVGTFLDMSIGLAHDMHCDKAIIWLSASVVSKIPATQRLMHCPHDTTLWRLVDLAYFSMAANSHNYNDGSVVNSKLTSVSWCVVVGRFTQCWVSSFLRPCIFESIQYVKCVGPACLPHMFHVCLACFIWVFELQWRACNRIYQHRHSQYLDPYMFIPTVYSYFPCATCISVWREAGCVCADALDWRDNFVRYSFQREREREWERERVVVPGTCTPDRDGWMEEGRDGDKQRQWRQGSVKETEGEAK